MHYILVIQTGTVAQFPILLYIMIMILLFELVTTRLQPIRS